MFKYLTPSWHPITVDYHNSIIIEGPDTADAVSLTKSYFSLEFGEEKPLSCPYFECPRSPENTWLLHKLHLCEIIGCEGISFIGSSGEGSSMQPWGGFLEEAALELKQALS